MGRTGQRVWRGARLALAGARVAVIASVYAGSTLAGAGLATCSARTGAPLLEYLATAVMGGSILPLALTVGFALWLLPSLLRQAEELVPQWVDAPLLLVPTVAVALVCASLVPESALGAVATTAGFGAIAAIAVAAVLASGGRHVAIAWLRWWL